MTKNSKSGAAGKTNPKDMEPKENVAFEDVTTDETPDGPAPSDVVDSEVTVPQEVVSAPEPAAAEEPPHTPLEEPRWPLDVWYDVVMRKVGQPYYVLAGALVEEDPDAEYTESQIRSLVEKFLNSPAR